MMMIHSAASSKVEGASQGGWNEHGVWKQGAGQSFCDLASLLFPNSQHAIISIPINWIHSSWSAVCRGSPISVLATGSSCAGGCGGAYFINSSIPQLHCGLTCAVYYLPRRNKNFKAKPSLPKVSEKQHFPPCGLWVKAVAQSCDAAGYEEDHCVYTKIFLNSALFRAL